MRVVVVGLLGLCCGVVLTGCGPEPDLPEPIPVPTSTSYFASETEALAAAEEMYRQYVAASNLVSAGGGVSVDPIRAYVTETWFATQSESFADMARVGTHLEGQTVVRSVWLQSYDFPHMTMYACHDISATRVVTSDGVDVTPPDRASEGTLVVDLVFDGDDVLVNGSELWSESC